jgi:hypothetical protein
MTLHLFLAVMPGFIQFFVKGTLIGEPQLR